MGKIHLDNCEIGTSFEVYAVKRHSKWGDYYNYINHYWSKSTEEFMNKLLRGDVALGNTTKHFLNSINMYFGLCDITLDKIEY